MEHTPTPKEVADVITHSYLSEHAAFIVRAVSNHPELLGALKAAQAHMLNADIQFHDDVLCRRIGDVIAKAEGVSISHFRSAERVKQHFDEGEGDLNA